MLPSTDDESYSGYATRGREAVRKIGAVFSDDGGVDPYVVTSPQTSSVANIYQRGRGSVKKGTYPTGLDLIPF